MKVSELIEFLQTQPQELDVAFRQHSEQRLMEVDDIKVDTCCVARPSDGWIHNRRADKTLQEYLIFPGN